MTIDHRDTENAEKTGGNNFVSSQARPRPPQADRGQAVPLWCEFDFTLDIIANCRYDNEHTVNMRRRPRHTEGGQVG